MAFQFGSYSEGNAARKARERYEAIKAPEAYASAYTGKAEDALRAIETRKPFTYDVNADALYRQYRDQYMTGGRQAMADTMGQAAAMTGGYGNSYAVTAGNQAYQAWLGRLNDIVPELYQQAYSRYRDEGQDLKDLYGLYTDREATDYGRYRDRMSDYQTDRSFYYGVANDERNWDYSLWNDEEQRRYQNYQLWLAENGYGSGSGSGSGGGGGRRAPGTDEEDEWQPDTTTEVYQNDRTLAQFYKTGSTAFPQGMMPLGSAGNGKVIAKDNATGKTYTVWVNNKGKVVAEPK